MLVFARACEMGLEGIVSKRAGSRYSSGNSRQWLKSKKLVFDPLHVAAFGSLIPGTHGAKAVVVGLSQPHFAPS
jgi:bifunctional non-homologous end joining protein LigD